MNYGALGSIPRQTKINGQPHMLAYINPEEEGMIQDYRGNIPPVVGPDGVPAYFFGGFFGGGGGSSSGGNSSSDNDNDSSSGGFFSGISDAISGIFGGISDAVSGIFGGSIDDEGTVTSAPVETTVAPPPVKEVAPVEIAEDRLDNKWGYTNPTTGEYVPAGIDMIDGGGKNSAGAGFAASGGVAADTNNDGFVSASEAEAVGGLEGNFFSGISNAVGATPLGSGLEATGLAKGLQYTLPGLLYTGAKYATDNFGTGDVRTGVERPDLDTYIAGSASDISPDTSSSFTEGGGSMPYSRDIYASQDVTGDFYGGRTGGMWDRFAGSYLTRYGYNPAQDREMIRKVENPDGTTSFYNLDGQLLDPEQIGDSYDVFTDPTQIKIGEEQVVVGQENYDAQGNLISTENYGGVTPRPIIDITGGVTPLPTPDPYPTY